MFKLLLIYLHPSIHQVRIPHRKVMAIRNHGSYPEQATSHKATLQLEHFITKVNPTMSLTINLWGVAKLGTVTRWSETTQVRTATISLIRLLYLEGPHLYIQMTSQVALCGTTTIHWVSLVSMFMVQVRVSI